MGGGKHTLLGSITNEPCYLFVVQALAVNELKDQEYNEAIGVNDTW